jgi:ribosomal protein S18 acetylase RimI-like enzyme
MLMYTTTIAQKQDELEQILALQQSNLQANNGLAEIESQGFVTVQHSLETLQMMNQLAPSIIIKDNDAVIAYALVMLKSCRNLIATLEPMFAEFDNIEWNGNALDAFKYYVMGQVCISKNYRGIGLFDQLYQKHREIYSEEYDFVLTEVALRNKRSLRAHERVGFKTVHSYKDMTDEWAVILWDWK